MTLLWIIVGFAAAVGVLFICSAIWPFEAGVLGHLAAPAGMLTSALVGINHMRAHRRVSAPKAPKPPRPPTS
jgi:hypothetical protein